jgi:hypothetical protein
MLKANSSGLTARSRGLSRSSSTLVGTPANTIQKTTIMRGVTVSNAAWSAASAVCGGGPGNRMRAIMPSTKGMK